MNGNVCIYIYIYILLYSYWQCLADDTKHYTASPCWLSYLGHVKNGKEV